MKNSILVLEDHSLLRRSMSRVLSELPDTEVDAVGTLQDALSSVRHHQPELVVADLELPDGSGIDLLRELSGSSVPFIFVSGYVSSYMESLGEHPSIIVREKPIPMFELQTLALAHIEAAKLTDISPFGVADYIQLACLGRHSVVIDIESNTGSGRIYIHEGEIWAAHTGDQEGLDAFFALALISEAKIICSRVRGLTVMRNVEEASSEYLLMEAARRRDEEH